MGLSTPLAKRRLLDWPDDVVDLADTLGLERFAVEGISGRRALRDRVRSSDPGASDVMRH